MTPLDLLHALHAHPSLTFHRVGDGLKASPRVPEEARPTLAHFKPALLRALEDGEKVESSRLLSSPWRLGTLLAHVLGVEEPVMLTLYAREGEEPRRYLAPEENLTPHLAWADRNLPPPWRFYFLPAAGGWALDWREGWEVALEAVAAGTRYLLFYPEHGARGWLEAARAGLALHGVSVWRPGTAPRPLLLTAA